jgi:hypothetical protein
MRKSGREKTVFGLTLLVKRCSIEDGLEVDDLLLQLKNLDIGLRLQPALSIGASILLAESLSH